MFGISLQSALMCALRMHARDAIKARYRAAGRKLTTITPAELYASGEGRLAELR
jgi:hypothetical protein